MLVHSLAGYGRPDNVTSLFLPRLATVLNTSAATNASGVGGLVCDAEECAALASFSLCLWVNVLLKMPASAVISYFISNYVHNALLIREWSSSRCLYRGQAMDRERTGLGRGPCQGGRRNPGRKRGQRVRGGEEKNVRART